MSGERIPVCREDRAGPYVEESNIEAVVRRVLAEEPNRTWDIPDPPTQVINVCASCGELAHLKRIEKAAREAILAFAVHAGGCTCMICRLREALKGK